MKSETSLKDIVYNSILEDIFSMEYRPGEILNEKKLIEKYNCSKSPVREALLALCTDNVLRSIPRYGYEVIRITKDDIFEMIQFRQILEGGMLKARYDKLTLNQLNHLEAIDQQCQVDDSNVWSHWEHNTKFHLKLISFCGNSFAADELSRCMNRLKRAYAQFYWDKSDIQLLSADTRHHAQILDALRKKEINNALQHLTEDLNDFGGLENYFL